MSHRVVVVGGGFGGLNAAHGLRDAAVEVTLVDRRNFHLFQPLLYQVATGALSPGEIAMPLRAIFRKQENVRILLAEVRGFDLDGRRVVVGPTAAGEATHELPYDSLVVSGGVRYSYFGHDDWHRFAPSLKSMEDALEIRGRILRAFEAAEVETDAALREAWLTFVVVGAGPTGVELAGQIAEIAYDTRRDFRSIDPRKARILLVEGLDRVLTTFPPRLSAKAAHSLQRLGVEVLLSHTVVGVDAESVCVRGADGTEETVATRTVLWAAGVSASPLGSELGEVDRAGRVHVTARLTLPTRPEVFVIGDMAAPPGPLPGVAQVAIQGGRYAAHAIRERLNGREPEPFHYNDKGNLATIGRNAAVAEIRGVQLSGFAAWVIWLVVHILYLVGFQNRLLVLMRWTFSYLTHGRGARLITGRED
jgi:NADH:quinone reductase (non-electrogenic)